MPADITNTKTSSQMSPTKTRTTRSTFIATGGTAHTSKIRTTKPTGLSKRKLSPEEKKKRAQERWKRAIRRVKAMLRFQIPLNPKEDEDSPPLKLAPTYKLSPDPEERFHEAKVKAIIETVLRAKLREYEYSRFTAPKLAKTLSSILNDEMKNAGMPRYKFISTVFITEHKKQGLHFTSRCVWDANTDSFASVEIVKPTFIAVACIHGVYLE